MKLATGLGRFDYDKCARTNEVMIRPCSGVITQRLGHLHSLQGVVGGDSSLLEGGAAVQGPQALGSM